MAYVPVPKDIANIKVKVAFGLTKRQIICFGSGALIGVPLFFLLKPLIGSSSATMVMMLVMLPLFFFGMYERHGQPLENVLDEMLYSMHFRPKHRPYETQNAYAALMHIDSLEREIKLIEQKNGSKTKTNTRRKKANQEGH